MRFGMLLANGLVIGAMGWMAALGGLEIRAREILPNKPIPGVVSTDLGQLEAEVAHAPSARAISALASAYLDRNQPGLAAAVIERAPREMREQPEVAHVLARTLFRRGQARQALAVARAAGDVCAESEACAPWILAKTARQVAFLEQVVAAGIDDPETDPAAVTAAYHRSTREAGMVAMR